MNLIPNNPKGEISKYVRIPVDDVFLLADLQVPEESPAVVLFASDGTCRNHPRTRHVARVFREKGLGTMLCDLLTDEEAGEDQETAGFRHNAALLARRLIAVTKWVTSHPDTKGLRVGYIGANAGAGAAVIAAAKLPKQVGAIVARDGRLDLALKAVPLVKCPTLLILGENDPLGMDLNRRAVELLRGEKELKLIPGASHLFGEPGKLETMAHLSADWLRQHLASPVHTG